MGVLANEMGMHSGAGWGDMMNSILDMLGLSGWPLVHLGEEVLRAVRCRVLCIHTAGN